ncbi:hypothetical protein vseg_008068 [Gypsophila vaccaria]
MALTKREVKTDPTWVQLIRLPLKFLGKSLPKISGLIGKYIKSDSSTEQRTKLGYARVMVEVTVDGRFPDIVAFNDENGELVQIKVEYEWKPITCGKCNQLGHHTDLCRKGPVPQQKEGATKKIWRPVVKPVVQPVVETKVPEEQEMRTGKPPEQDVGTETTHVAKPVEQNGYSNLSFGGLSYKEVLSPAPVIRNGNLSSSNSPDG